MLLIGWDGADWEHITPLLEEGLLPTLEGMINRGVKGNLATLQPILSPMLWNSVATGKLADKHGIHGFTGPNPAGGARPYTSFSRKCKALWNIFTQMGMRSNVVGWWASHPAEPINGCVVTNSFNATKLDPRKGWQIAPGTIHPVEKVPLLAPMRVLPAELTHEHILPFMREAAKIDQESDRRLQSFGKVLSDCASTHAVATTIMETEPWDFTAVYYDAIDHFSHAFMQFHPPQMENVEDDAFEIYRDMVLQAEAADPRMPGLYVQIGNVYSRLRRYAEAERAFKRAIEIHDDSAAAHQGLSFPGDIANVDVATAREESCGDAPPDSGSTGRDEYDLSWSNSVHGD